MPTVIATSRSETHGFSKQPQPYLTLIANEGIQGDAHSGRTVQHLYLKRKNAAAPNLCQVHLFAAEMLDELASKGIVIGPDIKGDEVGAGGKRECAGEDGGLLIRKVRSTLARRVHIDTTWGDVQGAGTVRDDAVLAGCPPEDLAIAIHVSRRGYAGLAHSAWVEDRKAVGTQR